MVVLPVRSASRDSVEPWLWSQDWLELLFAHWRVSVLDLRPHIPAALEIDTYNGAARVSAVAFRLQRVRRRLLPLVWPAAEFPELNLRTYVRYCGEPAIYFLSIHAGRRLATRLASFFTPLPYVYAPISFRQSAGSYRFQCPGARFGAEWTPEGPAAEVEPDSLDAWLLERYALYVRDARGTLFRTEVEHRPWTVCRARLTMHAGRYGSQFGLDLGGMPEAVHFSSGVQARVWPFTVVRSRQVPAHSR